MNRNGSVQVWGLPLVPWTRAEAVDAVAGLVQARQPSYFITANLHYAMLTAGDERLRSVNDGAAFLLADGAPLVIASRRNGGTPLPERVAGSDLIYDLAERAAAEGHRLFLLGGPPCVAEEAARRLVERYPGLIIAGTSCPGPEDLKGPGLDSLIHRIRESRPDILLVALGQPKGEFWIAENLDALDVPVCVQVGATLDFVAGRVSRAPKAFQRIHMEWAYRMAQEPSRLAPRYVRNGLFLLRMVARDALRGSRQGERQAVREAVIAGDESAER